MEFPEVVFIKKNAENVPLNRWKRVLRVTDFVYYCTYCAKNANPRTLSCLCFFDFLSIKQLCETVSDARGRILLWNFLTCYWKVCDDFQFLCWVKLNFSTNCRFAPIAGWSNYLLPGIFFWAAWIMCFERYSGIFQLSVEKFKVVFTCDGDLVS